MDRARLGVTAFTALLIAWSQGTRVFNPDEVILAADLRCADHSDSRGLIAGLMEASPSPEFVPSRCIAETVFPKLKKQAGLFELVSVPVQGSSPAMVLSGAANFTTAGLEPETSFRSILLESSSIAIVSSVDEAGGTGGLSAILNPGCGLAPSSGSSELTPVPGDVRTVKCEGALGAKGVDYVINATLVTWRAIAFADLEPPEKEAMLRSTVADVLATAQVDVLLFPAIGTVLGRVGPDQFYRVFGEELLKAADQGTLGPKRIVLTVRADDDDRALQDMARAISQAVRDVQVSWHKNHFAVGSVARHDQARLATVALMTLLSSLTYVFFGAARTGAERFHLCWRASSGADGLVYALGWAAAALGSAEVLTQVYSRLVHVERSIAFDAILAGVSVVVLPLLTASVEFTNSALKKAIHRGDSSGAERGS